MKFSAISAIHLTGKSVKKWDRDRLIKEALTTWSPGYLPLLLKPKSMTEGQAVADGADEEDSSDEEGEGDED